MWLALLASALARPRHASEPAAPTAPVPPAPGADDGFAALALPPLSGPAEIPNFQGLSRDTVTFTLDLDLSALAGLDDAGRDALFAALAADPGWRVGRDASGRVAWARAEGAGPRGWALTDHDCAHAAVREVPDPRFEAGSGVVTVDAGTAPITLPAFRPAGGACSTFATALRVRGGVEVDVFEAAGPEGRSFTLARLEELASLATAARALGASIVAQGHDPLAEPDPADGPGTTIVAAGPGRLAVSARLDAGRPAWVWLRVLDAAGRPWAEATVAAGTLERAGWATDPSLLFRVGSTFAASPGEAFAGTAEWWAVGDDGAVWRVSSAAVTVPAR